MALCPPRGSHTVIIPKVVFFMSVLPNRQLPPALSASTGGPPMPHNIFQLGNHLNNSGPSWTIQAAKGHDRHLLPSTNQSVNALPVLFYICAKYAVLTTMLGSVPIRMGSPFKLTPVTLSVMIICSQMRTKLSFAKQLRNKQPKQWLRKTTIFLLCNQSIAYLLIIITP